MIKLTDMQGNAVYINPDRVIGIHLRNNDVGTRVNYGGESYVVRESREEVASKVLEWQLSINDFRDSSRKRLYALAGLEEPNHD